MTSDIQSQTYLRPGHVLRNASQSLCAVTYSLLTSTVTRSVVDSSGVVAPRCLVTSHFGSPDVITLGSRSVTLRSEAEVSSFLIPVILDK